MRHKATDRRGNSWQIFKTAAQCLASASRYSALAIALLSGYGASAQTGGQGALEGTVLDSTGAVIPRATVTALDQASGVETTRVSSAAGLYSITPLMPGIYTITVKAPGFETLKQENIEVSGLTVTGFNDKLSVGNTTVDITVTEAPPQLQTTSASVQAVITNETYESLPLVMNN
jgi:hypothetical protein